MKRVDDKLLYLPTTMNKDKNEQESESTCEIKGIYPCPCCSYNTLPAPKEDAIAYICPVCFWENDVFTSSNDEPSDENHGMTLNEARRNYKILGVCNQDMLIHVRNPKPDEFLK